MARTRASDYEDKQRHLLDAAARVFADVGLDKASMAEIARRAGVSKALLYHYYAGKDALIFDIVRTHLDGLDAALADADDATLPGEDRLRRLVGTVMTRYRDAADEFRVQLTCTGGLSNVQLDALHALERRLVDRFAAVMVAIHPELDADRPLSSPLSLSLFGVLNWVHMWFRDDGAMSHEDYANVVTDLFIGGVGAVSGRRDA